MAVSCANFLQFPHLLSGILKKDNRTPTEESRSGRFSVQSLCRTHPSRSAVCLLQELCGMLFWHPDRNSVGVESPLIRSGPCKSSGRRPKHDHAPQWQALHVPEEFFMVVCIQQQGRCSRLQYNLNLTSRSKIVTCLFHVGSLPMHTTVTVRTTRVPEARTTRFWSQDLELFSYILFLI